MKFTQKILAKNNGDDGTTLIELLLTMVLTLIVVSVVPPLLLATSTADSASQEISYGTSSAQVAIQQIDNYVASSTCVYIPVSATTGNPSGSNTGSILEAASDAFGGPQNPKWVLWTIKSNVLYTMAWPDTGSNYAPPGGSQLVPLAQPIDNSGQPGSPSPFTITTGNLTILTTNLWVGTIHHFGAGNHPVDITNKIAALNTGSTAGNGNTCP